MQFNLSGESIRPIPTISLFLGCRCNNCLPPWIWSKLLGLCNPIQHFVLCWNIQSAVMFLCIKYINVLCSLYLMTEDDQMNSGSCMLSLTVCLILLLLCLISVCWYWLPLVCQDGGLLPGSSQLLCYSWSFCQIHRPGRARGAGLHQKPTEWVLLWWHLLK